ncbi:MAG: hypothetical protein DSO00_06320 [Archaeoglobi archaeon]|nr:MAG: hypothetical protein DSO00_06320 [Archaeoglobi archaeon]
MGYVHIAYLGFFLHGNIPKAFSAQNYLNLAPFIPELKLWVFWAPIFINFRIKILLRSLSQRD